MSIAHNWTAAVVLALQTFEAAALSFWQSRWLVRPILGSCSTGGSDELGVQAQVTEIMVPSAKFSEDLGIMAQWQPFWNLDNAE